MANVAVVGGGHAGHAVAGDLSVRGVRVSIFDFPEFGDRIDAIRRRGGIDVLYRQSGEEVFAPIWRAVTDIAAAIEGCEVILVCVPSYAHIKVAQALARHVRPEQSVILLPGSTGGALEVWRVFRESGTEAHLAETSTLPYAARVQGPASVQIRHKLESNLFFAAMPGDDIHNMLPHMSEIYPGVKPLDNVLETCLNNGNPVSHVPPAILNAGRIELAQGEYYNYKEGITPSVARVIEAVDEERMRLARTLEVWAVTTKERLVRTGYTPEKPTLYEQYHASFSFMRSKGPKSLKERYITEDVPFGLVTWSSIGREIGVNCPVMESLATLASALNGTDYFSTGRTSASLGLKGKSAEQMVQFARTGS